MHRSHPTTTRRKHLLKEMMEDDYALPTEQQQIVRVIASRGNNLHEVETPEEDTFLVSMPCKFRKNLWVKRGDFILVEPIEEGDKVKAEICKVLTTDHVKEYTKAGIWPALFAKKKEEEEKPDHSDSEDDLPPNTNRIGQEQGETSSEEDETTEDED
ncbi:probable RNA-binding protein EIF1AD [Drosophila tropicalis]|uniref:probable RNA-binding protein EIF1AD n=1 Tax=Drosophila tropicalis TaxID=46794 RepID=UPI0035AC1164